MSDFIFDKDPLLVGDSVWDLAEGSGQVTELLRGGETFQVQFGQRRYVYNLHGVGRYPRKTLYWRDPIGGYHPRKNDANWDMFSQIRDAVALALKI